MRSAYRKQLCINGPIERSQHLITQAARESETSESFGQIESEIGGLVAGTKFALWDEIESLRKGDCDRSSKTRRRNEKRPASFDTGLLMSQL